ncbi:hypothetical protein RJ640_026135 [Escallonia rubra]|uniref:RING-type E3 ubiquitin transferase n=1 Tax=Escallonia rubra TaxID=112253 RepID=A0AA88RPF6_9ASTE|nr:hypothetical protein RJ640_026135 [Escallonia rubra]
MVFHETLALPFQVPETAEVKAENLLTSAAAFVEGGIQEACDDSCSVCLEAFCDSDPSTVTCCKHEFHLQCILECQELLEAVEREKSFRYGPARNSTIFRHPTLGDFELQHVCCLSLLSQLPVGVNDAELEDRIIQHLAAAAAMGRTHHVSRREGSRSRSSAHGRPQFLVFSTHPNAPAPVSASPVGGEPEPAAIAVASPAIPLPSGGVETVQHTPHVPSAQISASASGSGGTPTNNYGDNRNSSLSSQDRAGPSDFQSISESWKSRLNAMSTRYKESISKSTRGWKEKLFSRNTSMTDIGSEVRREVNAGIATVSRMMDRLETREDSRTSHVPVSNNLVVSSVMAQDTHNNTETHQEMPPSDNTTAASAASSISR